MPMGRFLLGVFVAPVLLGLFFTPIFLLDMGGLAFDGSNLAETFPAESPVVSAKRRFSAVLNIFLYAYVLKLLIFCDPMGLQHLSFYCSSIIYVWIVAWVETKIVENWRQFASGCLYQRHLVDPQLQRCHHSVWWWLIWILLWPNFFLSFLVVQVSYFPLVVWSSELGHSCLGQLVTSDMFCFKVAWYIFFPSLIQIVSNEIRTLGVNI